MWRRGLRRTENDREPLAADQIMALMNTAALFHAKAQEERREKRWWIPIFVAVMGFVGAVLGAYLSSK